ncbi:hypothetical protein F0562_013612 [Nyssa sinensis]|uniref:ENT domain-containing protein n=1 Tax=Nyssa sinensis TaxID=561372 RepID=A0A5J4ZNS8_9ASTE|nr:hypothetical protein F0562_013612 [Nyssa sinensis]
MSAVNFHTICLDLESCHIFTYIYMYMENQEVLQGVRVVDGRVTLCGDGSEHQSSVVKESENLGVDLIDDSDLYLEEINDRLPIPRMVSDSVNAVEPEVAEKISAKELEVAGLRETLHFHQVGADKIELLRSPVGYQGPTSTEHGLSCGFFYAFVEHDKMRGSLGSLTNAAREQIKKVKEEIDGIRGCSPVRRNSSGSELVGLGGILQENASGSIHRTLDTLKITLDTICTRVDAMLHSAKASSLCEWQQEQDLQGELEALVIQSCIRGIQEEFEEKLWDQNAPFCGSRSVNWLEKINEISSLRKDLDAILKLLSSSETGHLISHGSYDIDHFHRKVLTNHVSSSTSLSEENGKFVESRTGISEKLEHMSKEALVKHYDTAITEMKRNHESELLVLAEDYYTRTREYFKERDSSLHLRKDKEFDVLRKKIPKVILKLDNILVENEKLATLNNNTESLGSSNDRLKNLLLENGQLRESLIDKEKELKCLSSQLYDATEKMSQHSSTEVKLLKLIGNLESAVEDARIEAFINEELYKCVVREVTAQIKCDIEESVIQSIVMQEINEISFRGVTQNAEATSQCEIQDLDLEFLFMQGLCGFIFTEAIKDAKSQFSNLNMKYLCENANRVSLEKKALEREKELILEIEEKERLKQEVLLDVLAALMKEKDKITQEASAALTKEREQFELASEEIRNLRDHASEQKTLISERNKESDLIKGELVQAIEQIEIDQIEMNKLNQKLEQSLKELKEADEERKVLLAIIQEKQNDLLLVQAKEKEQRKQMEALIVLVHGLSKALDDFECRASEGMKKNNLRLEYSGSQLSSLIQKAKIFRRIGLLYKERLERRCSDLQMAETEVDLLGDQVDELLSLLKKIYIALDHYSPILQHYPGIVEILKLVRREISGESTKSI